MTERVGRGAAPSPWRRWGPLLAVLAALVVVVLAGLASRGGSGEDGPPARGAGGGPAPTEMTLLVAPHPDDEVQGWSRVARTPDTHDVVVLLTRGEQTAFCAADLPGWDAAAGEAEPVPRPDGALSEGCGRARVASTVAFLEDSAEHDPTLPAELLARRTVGPLPADGVAVERCDDDGCTDARTALVSSGDGGLTLVAFDLGDGDVTEAEAAWAVRTVLDRPQAFGLPDLPWGEVVGATYAWGAAGSSVGDVDADGCFAYPHPDHVATARALDDLEVAPARRVLVATCAADATPGRATVAADVPADVFAEAFAVSDDGRRLGDHVVRYGWLLDPYWPGDPEGQTELFHRRQHFRVHGT